MHNTQTKKHDHIKKHDQTKKQYYILTLLLNIVSDLAVLHDIIIEYY